MHEHGQLSEQISNYEGTECVKEGRKKDLTIFLWHHIFSHQQKHGSICADPVLIVQVLSENTDGLPLVNFVHRRNPQLLSHNEAVPKATLNVHVEEKKEL